MGKQLPAGLGNFSDPGILSSLHADEVATI
jgi:hypothetical protein